MKKLLICALALGGFAASAQAADLGLDSMKDPLPDTLTFKGVTVYGAIDVGYAYQTHGAPQSGAGGAPLNFNMFGSAGNNKSLSTITSNGLTQSFVGVKFEEMFAPGWTVVGKAESGFDPVSGELADACAQVARNFDKFNFQQFAGGDGSRCGQFLNGPVYVGLSNAAYGTLTVGRQNSLDLDLLAVYDPMALSYAFSALGFSGTIGAGGGATEDSRWDNSLKYVYQYGPVHASFAYASGGEDTAMHGTGLSGGGGFTWRGLSVDGLYTKENDAIRAAAPISPSQVAGGLPAGFSSDKWLSVQAADISAFTVGAKYTFDVGGFGGWKDGGCGLKDDCAGAKLTFFAGYQRSDTSNPTDEIHVGDTTQGGYKFAFVDNNAFTTDRILQTAWAGAKYETGPWSFTGAYYHFDQNSYTHDNATCAQATATNIANAARAVGDPKKFYGPFTVGSNCSGNLDMGSFLVDYAFNKHFDVYAGVNYSAVDGGEVSGFLQDNSFLFMTGMRLRF